MQTKKISTLDSKVNSLKESSSNKSSAISKEFQNFLTDIEHLITEATSMTSDDINQAKTKLNERIDSIKHSFDGVGDNISSTARKGAAETNKYVHEQPWVAIGAGAAIGLLVGFLASRRS